MIKINESDGFLYGDISHFDKSVLLDYLSTIYEQFEGNEKQTCEALIQDAESLEKVIGYDGKITFEIGLKSELLSDWQENKTRNNEVRSFENWLSDKVENLFY